MFYIIWYYGKKKTSDHVDMSVQVKPIKAHFYSIAARDETKISVDILAQNKM